eukprot:TRINITY_DN52277_c0_g1_i1.p1 TRINITY_DN52277_c0_g1~~TRINITY_DN52277_c0_g1_i1.p1  ORF type:complete len:294 (+),score=73.40 TRINITY_DN52277_c0_g1_i1:80-961(+)
MATMTMALTSTVSAAAAGDAGASASSGPAALTYEELLAESVPFFGAQIVFYGVMLAYVKLRWPDDKDPWGLADLFVCLFIHPIMVYTCYLGVTDLGGSVAQRWHGRTTESQFFQLLYLTRSVLHCFVQLRQQLSTSHLALMTLHHVISAVCYAGGLTLGTMHYFACLDGMCEISSVFLDVLYALKLVKLRGKRLQDVVPGWVTAVNGVCLWVSWMIFRLVLFPFWLWTWWTDVSESTEQTWDVANTNVERYLYPLVTAVLLGLSIHWFIPITKGVLKAANWHPDSLDKKKKDE